MIPNFQLPWWMWALMAVAVAYEAICIIAGVIFIFKRASGKNWISDSSIEDDFWDALESIVLLILGIIVGAIGMPFILPYQGIKKIVTRRKPVPA